MVDLIDTNGVKPTLKKGVLGYDDYSVGGDAGRLYVGTGTASIAQAKKSEVDSHTSNVSNPHSVTKTQVGLGNVDNTSDVNKPVSTATQTALNTKVDKVTSTDNAIVRFDGTTGKVQNSGVIIDDNNNVTATTFSLNNGKGTMIYESPNMEFIGLNTDTIFGNTGAFNTKFYTNGAEIMRIDSAGNLLVGTSTDNGVDKLQVNGSINTANGSTLGGIKHSIITHVDTAPPYAQNAIHFKLNYKPTVHNKMISLLVKGWNYGTSESFNATVSTYVHIGNLSLINSCTTDSRCTFYKSSDGYLVLKIQLNASYIYNPSFVIDSIITGDGVVSSTDLIIVIYSSTNL